jgi:hypothetical protein
MAHLLLRSDRLPVKPAGSCVEYKKYQLVFENQPIGDMYI